MSYYSTPVSLLILCVCLSVFFCSPWSLPCDWGCERASSCCWCSCTCSCLITAVMTDVMPYMDPSCPSPPSTSIKHTHMLTAGLLGLLFAHFVFGSLFEGVRKEVLNFPPTFCPEVTQSCIFLLKSCESACWMWLYKSVLFLFYTFMVKKNQYFTMVVLNPQDILKMLKKLLATFIYYENVSSNMEKKKTFVYVFILDLFICYHIGCLLIRIQYISL